MDKSRGADGRIVGHRDRLGPDGKKKHLDFNVASEEELAKLLENSFPDLPAPTFSLKFKKDKVHPRADMEAEERRRAEAKRNEADMRAFEAQRRQRREMEEKRRAKEKADALRNREAGFSRAIDVQPEAASERSAAKAAAKHASKLGKKFVDPDFPPHPTQVGGVRGVRWLRPSDICGVHAKLFKDGIAPTDCVQGELGNCWFVAAVSCLAVSQLQQRLKNTFVKHDPENGIVNVRIFKHGQWREVTIDDMIPVHGHYKTPCFSHSTNPHEFWICFLEKAYAKLHGGYMKLTAGVPCDAFTDLTGGFQDTSVSTKMSDAALWAHLRKVASMNGVSGNYVMSAAWNLAKTPKHASLISRHAYGVLGGYEVPSGGRTVRLVKMRNPHGQNEWTGDWSDGDRRWDRAASQAVGHTNQQDGIFFMTFEDFRKHWDDISGCHMLPLGSAHRASLEGEWKGSPGPRNMKGNPRFELRSQRRGKVFLTLCQTDARCREDGTTYEGARLSVIDANGNLAAGGKGAFMVSRDVTVELDHDPSKGPYTVYCVPFSAGTNCKHPFVLAACAQIPLVLYSPEKGQKQKSVKN